MRAYRILLLALALAAAVAVSPTSADDKKNPAPKADPAADETGPLAETAAAAAELDLAQKLIEYGREKKAPDALVTAALILHRNPTDDIADLPADAKSKAFPAPADLLAEAKKLKPADKGVAALVEWATEELKVKERGSAGLKSFAGGKTLTVTIPFKAGEPASISVTASATFTRTVSAPPLGTKKVPYPGPATVQLTVVGTGAPAPRTGSGAVGTSFVVPVPKGVKPGTPIPYKVTVTVQNGDNPNFRANTN